MPSHLRYLAQPLLGIGITLLLPAVLSAQGAIKVVDNPGGGQFVYGPIAPGASERAVIVDLLTRIHQKFGASPRVGRVLRNKTGQSLAAFFDVKSGAPGGGPVSGMIILSEPSGGQGMAAVLYDASKNFPRSAGQMLRRLGAATGGGDAAASAAATGGSVRRPAAALRPTTFPDRSGSVGLPAGWQIVEAMGGYARLEGPKGQRVFLSLMFPVLDPRSPQVQQSIRTVGLPGSYVAVPYGADPVETYQTVASQVAQKLRRPQPAIRFAKVETGRGADGLAFAILTGQGDLYDGEGQRDFLVQQYVMGQPDAQGNWQLCIFQFTVPKGMLDQERATLSAIRMSYRYDARVIQGQTQEALARQRAWFDAEQAAHKANTDAFDARIRQHDAAAESQDKRNQAFSNYLLDQTAITDTRTGEQGTVSNAYAWSLMQHDPNFKEVPTDELLKGVTW